MLLSKVQDLYDKYDKVLFIDQHYFSTPFEEVQTWHNIQLKQYIEYYEPLIKESVDRALKMGSRFQPINTYFPSTASLSTTLPTQLTSPMNNL